MKTFILILSTFLGLGLGQDSDVEYVCKIVPRIPNFPYRDVSALGVAVISNSTNNIDLFLNNYGCDVNYDGAYREAEVTQCENPELFKLLNIPCKRLVRFEGYTPLNLATLFGTVDTVRRLLQVPGIDVNKASTFPSSPLSNAVQSGSLEMVEMLVEAGADLNFRVGENKNTLLMLAMVPAPGTSPSLPIFQYLIRKGVDVNAADDRGYTALGYSLEVEDPTFLQALVAAGLDLTQRQGPGQESPLNYAVRNNNTVGVKIILSTRPDLESTDSQGRTPLFEAARNGKVNIISQLVEAGANVNAKDAKENSTPLIYAVVFGHYGAVEYLIRNGADVDAQETNGLTATYYAAKAGNVRILDILVKAGADIDVQGGRFNLSPLMVAAYLGHVDIVRYLKDNGANLYLEDDNGDTALDHAERQNNTEVSRILREK